MTLTEERKKELEDIYQSFLHNEKIERMKNIPMHRGSNCYIHSFRVAKLAIKRALRHKDVNLTVVLLGSILHDYYLYDWREERDKMKSHVRSHPHVAAENAVRDFDIPKSVKKVIETHMWPFNFKEFPNSTEARIISLADKSIYFREIVSFSRFKKRHCEKYYHKISKLFEN